MRPLTAIVPLRRRPCQLCGRGGTSPARRTLRRIVLDGTDASYLDACDGCTAVLEVKGAFVLSIVPSRASPSAAADLTAARRLSV